MTQHKLIEGAIRASKTTICLWSELNALLEHPGIATLLARWTDDATYGILRPRWREIVESCGLYPAWHADEKCEVFSNGSRAYITGLKPSEESRRYGKIRGLTLARAYVDQAEEMPHDFFLELSLSAHFRCLAHIEHTGWNFEGDPSNCSSELLN